MKNYDQKLKLLSLINEKILNRSTEERYRLMHSSRHASKKKLWIPIVATSIAAVLLLSVVTVLLIPLLTKQIPVYTGMTVSSANEGTARLNVGVGDGYVLNVGYRSRVLSGKSAFENEQTIDSSISSEKSEDQDDPFENIQASEDMYVAKSGEKICITIHFNNPNQYEILSFTINGVKYGSHMFLEGSDMENLIVEYEIPKDADGELECTIDAIKYIDGTKIKDVKIGGEKTVRIRVVAVSGLTFDLNGGNPLGEFPTFYYKDAETALPIPSKEDFIFDGWIFEGQSTPVYVIPKGLVGDLVLKATWKSPSDILTYLCDAMSGHVVKEFYEENRFVETTKDYRSHIGVDIAVPMDAKVLVAASGSVAKIEVDEYGSYVIEIELSNIGAFTVYRGIGSVEPSLKVGDTVVAGDVIGRVGTSLDPVCVDEPHLHFGIRRSEIDTEGWMDPQK